MRAQTGKVRVFGIDPVSEPVAVLGCIGYLSEQPDLRLRTLLILAAIQIMPLARLGLAPACLARNRHR